MALIRPSRFTVPTFDPQKPALAAFCPGFPRFSQGFENAGTNLLSARRCCAPAGLPWLVLERQSLCSLNSVLPIHQPSLGPAPDVGPPFVVGRPPGIKKLGAGCVSARVLFVPPSLKAAPTSRFFPPSPTNGPHCLYCPPTFQVLSTTSDSKSPSAKRDLP